MIVIGGEGYRWTGLRIRAITHKSKQCVSMPRKESVLTSKCKINPGALYEVNIVACGNGKISVGFDTLLPEEVFIVAADFINFKTNIDALGIASPDTKLVLKKVYGNFGNVYVHKVSIIEIDRKKTNKELELENNAKKNLERIKKQKAISKDHSNKEKEYRKEYNEYLRIARGEKMGTATILGGKGFRWKGRNIKISIIGGDSVAIMDRPGAMAMSKVKISPNAWFNVEIKAVGGKVGNGNTIVNFFAGKKYDGPQKLIKINGTHTSSTIISLQSPNFPVNSAVYLRIWRPQGASGSVSIRSVKFTQIKDLRPPVPKHKVVLAKHKPKKRVKHKQNITEEDFSMKFRPYALNKNKIVKGAAYVLINQADQVPKVSIITPTRNGIDLLKKCYTALNKNTSYPNWEWVIGDSDSDDGTAEYIKGLNDDRIILIERGTTKGSFSSINNELAEKASGEYYLFLNDDVQPQRFWLYEMMSKIHNNSDIGIVGARLMYNDKKLQHAGIMFIKEGPINVGKDILKPLGGENFICQDRFLQAVTGACMLMRKKDFEKVSGFDPVYYFCYEDVDLCLKIRYNLNKRILYAANAMLYHEESITQKKYKTSGELQKKGIQFFKNKWMQKVDIDFVKFCSNKSKDIYRVDATFVTCINDMDQYNRYIVGSLFKTDSKRNYEVIPVINYNNKYSAAEALNIGIGKARGDIVVLCHQDILFFKEWVDTLFKRIAEIEKKDKKWGVLGTAGITGRKDNTVGIVYNLKGKLQWRQTVKYSVFPVQTVDEHCMIIRKSSRLMFDQNTFNGFHFYGPDICLNASVRGMKTYGILCPLVHSSGSGSLKSGEKEYMRLLNALSRKWGRKFPIIRTTTARIAGKRITTFIKF